MSGEKREGNTCPRCGRSIERGWNFCPFCGFRPESSPPVFSGTFGGIFDKLMKRLAKQMEDIDTQTMEVDRNFEVMDLSPFFRNMKKIDLDKHIRMSGPNAKGFTIRISKSNQNDPKVDVKTFGNMDEAMQKQIQEQLKRMGIRQPARQTPARPARPGLEREKSRPASTQSSQPERKRFPAPKITEEPRTGVRRVDSKVYVDMDVPGVKGEQDIEIIELEGSVEVRAMAGDKAYFKIITKPAEFRLVEKKFSNGRLHLEFA